MILIFIVFLTVCFSPIIVQEACHEMEFWFASISQAPPSSPFPVDPDRHSPDSISATGHWIRLSYGSKKGQ